MKELGQYEWRQLSIWDFPPKKCVEKFIKSEDGKHVFHFYLIKIKEIVSDNQWKTEVVESLNDIPEDVLNWRNDNYSLRIGD